MLEIILTIIELLKWIIEAITNPFKFAILIIVILIVFASASAYKLLPQYRIQIKTLMAISLTITIIAYALNEYKRIQESESVINSLNQEGHPNNQVSVQNEVGKDYKLLEKLLAVKKWKEADKTTRLLLLKVSNREEQENLDSDDWENFPCTDLRIIDKLWVKYSKGHFGFSVQQRIWESLGTSADYHKYDKFAVQVGWMDEKKGSLKYSGLTFNLTAKRGHLPWLWNGEGIGGVWGEMDFDGRRGYIFSRTKACHL